MSQLWLPYYNLHVGVQSCEWYWMSRILVSLNDSQGHIELNSGSSNPIDAGLCESVFVYARRWHWC